MHGPEKGDDGWTAHADRREGSALNGLLEPFELLGAHALLGIGAPLDARGPDGTGVHMAALLACGIRLVAPDLDLLAALPAPDILRLGRPYLNASWASFFEHDCMIPLWRKNIYDVHHTDENSIEQRA